MKRLLLAALLAAPLCAQESKFDSYKKKFEIVLKTTGYTALATITGAGQILATKAFKGNDLWGNATSFEKQLFKRVYRAPGTTILGTLTANMLASFYVGAKQGYSATQDDAFAARMVGPALITTSIFMPSQGKTLDDINEMRRWHNIEPFKKTATREFLNAAKQATFKTAKAAVGVTGAGLWAFGLADIIDSGKTQYSYQQHLQELKKSKEKK